MSNFEVPNGIGSGELLESGDQVVGGLFFVGQSLLHVGDEVVILGRAAYGLEIGVADLLVAVEPDPLGYQPDSQKLVDSGIENRMEMFELELQIAHNLSTIDFLKNQTLPSLSLNYDYSVHGLGQTKSGLGLTYKLECVMKEIDGRI